MRYLVDTDWVIHALHGSPAVVQRLEELTNDGIGISIISTAELYQGVFYSIEPQANEALLLEFISGYDVIQVDDEICRIFANERGRLKAAGTPVSDLDLLIGCTALRHGLTLLSNNRRHFRRLQGLSIISI
jgi:tRNA(fMet)-specific endonuclease VapC